MSFPLTPPERKGAWTGQLCPGLPGNATSLKLVSGSHMLGVPFCAKRFGHVRSAYWEEVAGVVVLRQMIGRELRRRRQGQGRTLRDVSGTAQVSLGYLSEVERGQKEASSELLSAICRALAAPISDVLAAVSEEAAKRELEAAISSGRATRAAHILAA